MRLYPNEIFKEIPISYPLKLRYAISNRGRVVSYNERVEDGNVLKDRDSKGYKTFRYTMRVGGKTTSKRYYLHKLLAEFFIAKPSAAHEYVIHLDYDYANNALSNLRWATKEEARAHRNKSPKVAKTKRELLEHNIKADGRKLSVTNVIHLKKLLQDPKRKTRLKMLAKQFGISEMQVSRIKSGENWGHVKV